VTKVIGILFALLLSVNASADTIKLNSENTVFLKDIVEAESVTKAMSELSAKADNKEPVIYLVLDTPGGSVFDGLNLIHFLKGFNVPVKTITVFSASMGFQIAEGNPGARLILDTGTLMSHPMSGGERGQFGKGLSVEKRIGQINEIIDTMDKQVVSRTNGKQTLESYQKSYNDELWTTGQNAVDTGYADEVVTISCSAELLSSNDIVNVREYVGGVISIEIKYETSKCPLMLSVLKYQVAIVNLSTGQRFVLENKGYNLEEKEKGEQLFKKTDSLVFAPPITYAEITKITESSKRYKAFMFFKDRNFENIRKFNWL
jgi:ATP-dependent Clp protease protease subunit